MGQPHELPGQQGRRPVEASANVVTPMRLAITPRMHKALNDLRVIDWTPLKAQGWNSGTPEGVADNARIDRFFARAAANPGQEITIDSADQHALYTFLMLPIINRTTHEAHYPDARTSTLVEINDSLRELYGRLADATGEAATLNSDPMIWIQLGMPERLSAEQLEQFARTSDRAAYLRRKQAQSSQE